MESHSRDLENYVNVARHRRRRAKALLDFERHDDDELGFRKNDVITVNCSYNTPYDALPTSKLKTCAYDVMIFAGDLAEGRALLGGRVERSSRLVSGKVCRTSRRTKQTLLDRWRRLRQRNHHRPRPRRVRHNPHPPSLLFTLIKIIDAP